MKMKVLVMSVLACVMSSMAFAGDTPVAVDKMKAAVTPGEFVLTGTEVKTLHDGKSKEYKVCVKKDKDAAAMKVDYDAQQAVVQPGDCKNVAGKKITATAEHTLSDGAHIVGTYHSVKKK